MKISRVIILAKIRMKDKNIEIILLAHYICPVVPDCDNESSKGFAGCNF
jgi:hypothetical protein